MGDDQSDSVNVYQAPLPQLPEGFTFVESVNTIMKGMSYCDTIENINETSEILLACDPNNHYDPKAITVHLKRDGNPKIGFLSAEDAHDIFDLINYSTDLILVHCHFAGSPPENGKEYCPVQIDFYCQEDNYTLIHKILFASFTCKQRQRKRFCSK